MVSRLGSLLWFGARKTFGNAALAFIRPNSVGWEALKR
jgi:hypothetical protein